MLKLKWLVLRGTGTLTTFAKYQIPLVYIYCFTDAGGLKYCRNPLVYCCTRYISLVCRMKNQDGNWAFSLGRNKSFKTTHVDIEKYVHLPSSRCTAIFQMHRQTHRNHQECVFPCSGNYPKLRGLEATPVLHCPLFLFFFFAESTPKFTPGITPPPVSFFLYVYYDIP